MSIVRIAPAALHSIAKEARASIDGCETGGILLGFEGKRAVVTEAGGPGPNAERSRTFFRRDLEHAEALAERAFLLDGSQWIGDWHTHPAGGSRPSATDLHGYRKILQADSTFPAFLAIIVTPSQTGWDQPTLSPWLIDTDREGRIEIGRRPR